MEFGLNQLRTGLRPASSRFELSRHVEIARTCSKLVADLLEAKFHYAIWFEAGSKLIADRFKAGRGPVADLLARASSLISQISARCKSATSFEPDSVMEFGLKRVTQSCPCAKTLCSNVYLLDCLSCVHSIIMWVFSVVNANIFVSEPSDHKIIGQPSFERLRLIWWSASLNA